MFTIHLTGESWGVLTNRWVFLKFAYLFSPRVGTYQINIHIIWKIWGNPICLKIKYRKIMWFRNVSKLVVALRGNSWGITHFQTQPSIVSDCNFNASKFLLLKTQWETTTYHLSNHARSFYIIPHIGGIPNKGTPIGNRHIVSLA